MMIALSGLVNFYAYSLLKADFLQEAQYFAYVHYMVVTEAISGFGKELWFVGSPWPTDVEEGRTLNNSASLRENKATYRKLYALGPSSSIICHIQALKFNSDINPFAT